ncbi:MAG: hypothetical protein CSA81_12955 [Acidobacteria bacterium]|nr:MAG: hypothetical protein CSA81_12955 [Acidobacteriota bacterium]PIE89128.1 MAG: hypothetical protein CR997_12695 [Acidobacteriota bacterium]
MFEIIALICSITCFIGIVFSVMKDSFKGILLYSNIVLFLSLSISFYSIYYEKGGVYYLLTSLFFASSLVLMIMAVVYKKIKKHKKNPSLH